MTDTKPLVPSRRTEDISKLSSITRTIYCSLSGIPLSHLEIRIFEGSLAFIETVENGLNLHPFYKLSGNVLLGKLEDSLHQAQSDGWILGEREKQRLCLLTSAVLYSLDALKLDRPALPKFEYAAASAGRLLGIAKWFFFSTSQRIAFPVYSVSKRNENLDWNNFKHWIDSAYELRNEWTSKSREYAREAQQRSNELALKEIKSESFRRVDTKKVWNWVLIQLEEHEAPGRLVTWENLFLNGDLEAHEWTADDVDDLQFAIVEHCDQGNEIMFFIKKRLDGIRGLIRSFYSDFTLIGASSQKRHHGSEESYEEQQTEQERAFIATFDAQAEALEELPPAPKRESFASAGLFYKAQAQWNILKKRFDAKKKPPEEPESEPEGVPA